VDVILVTSSYPLGPDDAAAAAGLFVRDFALEAARQGHRVRVLTQAREGEVQEDATVRVRRHAWWGDQPLSTLRPSRPRELAGMLSVMVQGTAALDAWIREERPDLVVAFWAVPAGLSALWARIRHGIAYRVWALGSDIWTYGRRLPTRVVLARVLRGAQQAFADGIGLAREVTSISSIPCEFLPSARHLTTGQPRPAELAAGMRNFLFVGRYHPNKGADLLVEAVHLLGPARRDACRFHLFGGGPGEERLRSLVDRHGLGSVVRVSGFADRRTYAAYLEHCHALVIPSRIESVPLSLSDAAQAGCPLVVTDVGDMGEIVRRHRCGLVAAPTVEGLRGALVQARDMDRAGMDAGLRSLAEAFSLEGSVRRMLAQDLAATTR
jgi:glycosyltransferase involved in cell wall biosynthesis